MFAPGGISFSSDTDSRPWNSTRSGPPKTRWEYIKTFYYDPVKW